MDVGSLFSGVGGMDYGLHLAGHRHLFFCESDPWRREVLAKRWPGVPVYDDVRGVGREPDAVAAATPPDPRRERCASDVAVRRAGTQGSRDTVDLLCGGFPCQDLSVAGQRRGLAGDRSGLFFEFARIIDALRPRWVLLENVPGLLSSNGGRDFGTVLGTLADIGYGMGWRILDSRFFGVPQRRRRVFIVGARADGDPAAAAHRAGQVLAVGSRCPGHPPTGTQEGQDTPDASRVGFALRRDPGGVGQGHNTNYVASTLQGGGGTRGHRLDAEAAAGGHLVAEPGLGWNWQTGGDFRPMFGDRGPALQKNQTTAVGVRRLTPVECERLQGLPDGWTQLDATTPDSRRYSALGDAVTASVAEWIGGRLQ